MRPEFPRLATVLASLLMLAACSASGISSPAQSHKGDAVFPASDDQRASATSGDPLGEVASEQPSPSIDRAAPSIAPPTADAALENLLPNEIGGMPAHKGSMRGDLFLASGMSTPDLGGYLVRLGVQPQDISISYAYTVAGHSGSGVFAFHVIGVSQQDLMRAVTDGPQPEIRASIAWQSKMVGGKPTVTAADPGWPAGNSVYRYAAGSVVFFISAGHESTAGEILASLP